MGTDNRSRWLKDPPSTIPIEILKAIPRALIDELIPIEILKAIPRALIDELRAIPVDKVNDKIVVVTDSVYNLSRIVSEVRFLTGQEPIIYLASPALFSILYSHGFGR